MEVVAKHPKGSVCVEAFQGRLRLRFRYQGERKVLSLGIDDSPGNRKIAEAKAIQIELDIKSGKFDGNLNKYRPEHMRLVVIPSDQPLASYDLEELWKQYTQYKSQHLEETTIIRDYGKIAKRLKQFPTKSLDCATEIEAYLLKTYAPETAKRTLKALSGCCNWGLKRKLINFNPFEGMAKEIVSNKPSKQTRKAYSKEERDFIISAFENDTYSSKFAPVKHSYYAGYVKFLFFTGCRPEDAIALKWKHIQNGHVIFMEAVATDLKIRKDCKTHTIRMFKINSQLQAILNSVKPLGDIEPESLVFPARNGREIDSHNFLNRMWKPVIQKLVAAGKVREYLPQNNARHTFISGMLEAGIDPKDIAPIVGNSPEVIYKNYASRKVNFDIPEL